MLEKFKSKENFPDFIEKVVEKNHIICISESKLIDSDVVDIKGYYIFVNHQLTKNALLFSLNDTLLEHYTLFFSVYFEPESSRYFNKNAYDEFQSITCSLNFNSFCLLGDFNSRTGELSDILGTTTFSDNSFEDILHFDIPERKSKDKITNNMGHELLSFCKVNQFVICNGRIGQDASLGELTCKNASVVDYVIISQNLLSNIYDFKIDGFDELFSDVHCPVVVKFLKKEIVSLPNNSGPDSRSDSFYTKWDRNASDNFTSYLNSEKIESLIENLSNSSKDYSILTNDEVTNYVKEAQDILIEAAKASGMIKTKRKKRMYVKSNKKVWFDKNCKIKKKIYNKLRKKDDASKNLNPEIKNLTKSAAKEYKKTVRKCYNNYIKNFHDNLRKLKSNSPKDYWNLINKQIDSKSQKQASCDEFFNFFKNLGVDEQYKTSRLDSHEEASISNHADPPNPDIDLSLLNDPITDDDISYALQCLKNNKCHGSDLILNEFLKHAEGKMIDIFVHLFNIILNTGFIPEDWTIGILRPIYKNKGSRSDPNNYRGISILSCFSKLFTSVLNTRIKLFFEENEILGNEQAAFRNNFSTTDHLFSLYMIIDLLLAKKKRLYVAFLDFEKAFDKINWAFLWQKLISSNVSGKILTVIKNMYYTAKSCVIVDDEKSDFYRMSVGIRQGENLSPILFSLFLNDMKSFLKDENTGLKTPAEIANELHMNEKFGDCFLNLFILLYADDSVIFAETPEILQQLLSKSKSYCDKWKLKLNARKCKIVIFSRGKVQKYPKFYIGEESIEVVSSFVYLGLKLNYNNKMNVALRDLSDRASRAMFSLLKKSKYLNLPLDITIDL